MKNNYKVYRYTSKTSGKCYIGVTKLTIKQRSFGESLKGYKGCRLFWNAIQKYGPQDFKIDILHRGLSKQEAAELEQKEIRLNNSEEPNGYNLENGGFNPRVSKSTQLLISKALTGKPRGKMSEETKKKLSEARKGKIISEETKYKISQSLLERNKNLSEEERQKRSKAQSGENNPMHGKKHSKEAREKMSKAGKGKKLTEQHRKNISKGGKGKIITQDCRDKISKANKGSKRTKQQRKNISEGQKGFNNWRNRKRIKSEWMWILTVSRFWYETHDYTMKRREEFFNQELQDTSNGEQLELF